MQAGMDDLVICKGRPPRPYHHAAKPVVWRPGIRGRPPKWGRDLVKSKRKRRGEPILESVCNHWGVGEIPGGTATWCERCSQWVMDREA